MEFIEDYDFELHYHPGKANVVADALSKNSISDVACIAIREWEMLGALGEFDFLLGKSVEAAALCSVVAQHTLVNRVLEAQRSDIEVESLREKISSGKVEKGLIMYSDLSVRYRDRLFVPESCREEVLREFHHSRLAVHPGGTKMYRDLGRQVWWRGRKKDEAVFVSKCLTCQQVKAEHQRPAGLL